VAATTTFLQLQTEFYARGFDYLNDGGAGATRAKAWINQAYDELCEEELWPFLLTTASGAAPLTVADIRTIMSVVDTVSSRVFAPVDEDELTDDFLPLTTAGTPSFYYVDDTIVRTYPVGGTLTVRYWKVPVFMSATTDIAIVPDRFVNLIVDGAVRRAQNDNDNAPGAQQAEAERQAGLERMRYSLFLRDGLRNFQRVTFASGDW
jgi:hypothetical protein